MDGKGRTVAERFPRDGGIIGFLSLERSRTLEQLHSVETQFRVELTTGNVAVKNDNPPCGCCGSDPPITTYRRIATLKEILTAFDRAVDRAKAGRYGVCALCDEQIPTARLKIVPFTRYCVRCQALVEDGTLIEDADD